jgi:hypothetical protein
MKKSTSSRITSIETSLANVKYVSSHVGIFHMQCASLVRSCLEGGDHVINQYVAASNNDNYMWGFYTSKKLRHLISSLDGLISIFQSIICLLQSCVNEWCRMALVLATFPLLEPVKTFTEFDLLLKELRWKLDTITYLLDLTEDFKLNWDANNCRYVLDS